jgi:hypothetical protein
MPITTVNKQVVGVVWVVRLVWYCFIKVRLIYGRAHKAVRSQVYHPVCCLLLLKEGKCVMIGQVG